MNACFAELHELAKMFWHKTKRLRHGEYLVHAADAAAPCAGQHIGLKRRKDDEEHAEGTLFENNEEPIWIVE